MHLKNHKVNSWENTTRSREHRTGESSSLGERPLATIPLEVLINTILTSMTIVSVLFCMLLPRKYVPLINVVYFCLFTNFSQVE